MCWRQWDSIPEKTKGRLQPEQVLTAKRKEVSEGLGKTSTSGSVCGGLKRGVAQVYGVPQRASEEGRS